MKIIAYYLPQFHEIPENDAWWGKGFTEWTNVKKAKPLFINHYQPRIPLNNNYYDLSNVNNIKWQADLATKYGIYGFAIYHYWFNGKLLLERPAELLLNHKEINIHFCLCWANENWTNGWVSDKNNILISNDFNDKEDWRKHFLYFLSFFRDKRYIQINKKPLLIIYYPSNIQPLKEMLNFWEKMAISEGFNGITFVFQHPLFYYDKKSKTSLFDYGIEFEPQFSEYSLKKENAFLLNFKIKLSTFVQKKFHLYKHLEKKELRIYDYDLIWKTIINQNLDDNIFPGAFVDWDNTSRKGNRGSVIQGACPQKFKFYFNQLVLKTRIVYKKDYIFIFAWNEWGECGYLEPDEKWKYQYLESIFDVLKENKELPDNDLNS